MKHSNSFRNYNRRNDKTEEYLKVIKEDDYNESYPSMANYLQNKIINHQTKEKRISFMEKIIFSRKIKLAFIIIVLAIIGAACSMPVAQDDTIGYIMKWDVKKSNTDALDKINNLNWVKQNQVSVTADETLVTNSDLNSQDKTSQDELLNYSVILQNTKEDVAKSYKYELEKISGISNITLTPLTEKVKRSLFSSALNKIFKVEIDVSNMNDQEVEKNLLEQFHKAGIQNVEVKFSRDENGKRSMTMKLTKDSKEGGNYDIKVKDNDKMLRLKKVDKNTGNEDLMNKTDAEIRDQVRKDLDNPNIKDDEIIITRDKGNVNVNVHVKKDTEK